MRKTLALLVIFLLLAVPVHAQGDLRLASVSVDLWPEYDQPAVLVIYHLDLAPETSLPVTLTLTIPARAQLNAVAYLDASSGLLLADYTRTVRDDWADLVITTNSLQVQVEYYDVLERSGEARHYVYEWTGPYAVGLLQVNLLEPEGSQELVISPSPLSASAGQDGLTNHVVEAAGLAAGQTFTVTVDYTRSGEDLHISSLPVEPVSTPGADTPGRVSMTGVLPWVLAGLGLILMVAGGVALFTWRSGKRLGASRRRHASPGPRASVDIYCPQCGKRAEAGDAFCRTCGSRLHRED